MKRIFRFFVDTMQVFPLFDDNAAITYEAPKDERYKRVNLTGEIKLLGTDYDFIDALDKHQPHFFSIEVLIGSTWEERYRAQFAINDCKFDLDNKTVVLKSVALDAYTQLLDGLDTEYYIRDLVPYAKRVLYHVRPVIQLYVAGSDSITNWCGPSIWDTEVVKPIIGKTDLESDYKFYQLKQYMEYNVLPYRGYDVEQPYVDDVATGNFKVEIMVFSSTTEFYIYRVVPTLELVFKGELTWALDLFADTPLASTRVLMEPQVPEYSDYVYLYASQIRVYGRVLTADDLLLPPSYQAITADDIAPIKNYKYRAPYTESLAVFATTYTSSINAAMYGANDYGRYFGKASSTLGPLDRNSWVNVSLWVTNVSIAIFDDYKKDVILRDAYLVKELISRLAVKIDEINFIYGGIVSEFFNYSDVEANSPNVLSGVSFQLLITPATNVMTVDYEKAALNGKVTLASLLDLLKIAFKCHWYINENNHIVIEHSLWYSKGKSYTTDNVCIDTTLMTDSRNKKPIIFGQNKYEYDSEKPAREIHFEWSAESNHGFSKQVIKPYTIGGAILGPTKSYSLSNFNADIEAAICNSSSISKDTLLVLGCTFVDVGLAAANYYKIILRPTIIGPAPQIYQKTQNAHLTWYELIKYYYSVDSVVQYYHFVYGSAYIDLVCDAIGKDKVQTIKIPSSGLDMYALIKTTIGSGYVEKASINLSNLIVTAVLRL